MKTLLTLACLALLSGCSLFQPNAALVRGIESSSSPILEEYEEYVIQRKPLPAVKPEEMDIRWKRTRQDSVDGFRSLLKEAKK
jgi:hypothetical protein